MMLYTNINTEHRNEVSVLTGVERKDSAAVWNLMDLTEWVYLTFENHPFLGVKKINVL